MSNAVQAHTPRPADGPRPAARQPQPQPDASARRRGPGASRVDDLFDRQRTGSDRLPDPTMLIVNLTRYAVEIHAGSRELDQIGRWIDGARYRHIHETLLPAGRPRRPDGRLPVTPRYRLGGTMIDRPADGVLECVTVIFREAPARCGSIALRLVGIDGRWRATEILPVFR